VNRLAHPAELKASAFAARKPCPAVSSSPNDDQLSLAMRRSNAKQGTNELGFRLGGEGRELAAAAA
jgi:hypothetical protein